MFTREQWARDLLAAMGNVNPSQTVLDFVVGWTTAETNTDSGAKFNLLNTTQPASDATNFNSVGVKNYTSYKEGIDETVATLNNGFYHYLPGALIQNADIVLVGPTLAILKDLNTWCGGCGYGAAFITLGQAHRNDPFSYGTAPDAVKVAPAPIQIEEANDRWDSFFNQIGETSPPKKTGIFDSWVEEWTQNLRQFGPPITWERPGQDWQGKPIVYQVFAHGTCEWDGAPHWFDGRGPIS